MARIEDGDKQLHPDTIAVIAGRQAPVPDGPVNAPVVFSSTYHSGGPVAYARDGNPTWNAFEEILGVLDGGQALVFSSGMAASAAVLECLPMGATVVMPDAAYFGTRSLVAERAATGRFTVRHADILDVESTLRACDGADLLWIESPTNPLLQIADVASLSRGARELGVLVVVDNTFATPVLQRPLQLGADVVVYSVTKFLAGHSDVVMGATVAATDEIQARLVHQRHSYGGIPGPMEVFLATRGMRTLPLRLARGQESALILATRLRQHPAVNRVRYPGLPDDAGHALATKQMAGFGAVLSFEVAGGAEAADRVAEAVCVITQATSLGGVESLIERRARWPGEDGTPASLLRLSVGCEHVEDLWEDLEGALDRLEPVSVGLASKAVTGRS